MENLWNWLVWFVCHWITRYVASWLLCALVLFLTIYYGWNVFRDERRPDRNSGHCTIDFGGQWLMGAMILQGRGRDLYNRYEQRALLRDAYPPEDEVPESKRSDEEKGKHDASELMGWFMGSDDREHGGRVIGSLASPLAAGPGLEGMVLLAAGSAHWKPEEVNHAARPIGGPLYPPINGLYFAPLATLRPLTAYRTNQVLCLVWGLLAGLGMSYLSQGRFWWPLAAALVMIYPGFKGAFHLGQNAPLTLLFLIWGWALLVRGHPVLGGIAWGLLAFKPVWAMAFFLVPFATGRFRFCLAMLATGVVLAAATLPFVGVHSWLEWLKVGKIAADLYNTDQNWVFVMRDLLGIPRRWMLDFSIPGADRDRPAAALVGWALWVGVLEISLLLLALRWQQARSLTGPAPAFLLLAAWMTCYHFMYYDVLLSLLPFFLLCTEPREFIKPYFLAILPLPRERLPADLVDYYRPRLPREYPSPVPFLKAEHRHIVVLNRMVPNVLIVLLIVEHLFLAMGIGASVTGWWTEDKPFPVTIQWEAVSGRVTTAVNWTPHPFKISSGLYVDGQPWDTYVLMFLWVWCGLLWIWLGRRPPAAQLPQQTETPDVMLVPATEWPRAIHPA